jgi:hypothetical protein
MRQNDRARSRRRPGRHTSTSQRRTGFHGEFGHMRGKRWPCNYPSALRRSPSWGHADDARSGCHRRFEQLLRVDAWPHLGAGADQHHLRILGVLQHVGALAHVGVDCRCLAGSITGRSCRLSAKKARALALEARRQQAAVSLASAGRKSVRSGTARSHQVLDGLVRGAVFAEADGVVREDEDGVRLHERGEADGRLAVVGKCERRLSRME